MIVNPFVSPFPKSPFSNPFPAAQQPRPPQPQSPQQERYLNFLADRSGCGMWRIGWPEYVMNMTDIGETTSVTKMVLDEAWFKDIKTVKFQRQASTQQKQYMAWVKSIQSKYGFKMMYEVDDVVFREEIPDYNVFKTGFDTDEVRQNCIDMINMCDEVTVTCKYMRDLFIEKTGKKEISVVPNFPPYFWMGHQYNYHRNVNNYDKNIKKPRIIYSGSGAHFDMGNRTNQQDDFSHVLKFIEKNVDKYQFVFIGAIPPPLNYLVQNRKIEYHPWVSLLEYPNFLASLNAQLFLAPLVDNNFNRSKSDIKYIEASCLGIPCLCQDMVTYENALPDLKFSTGEELEEKVDKLLNRKNKSKYYKLIPDLREIGSQRFLEKPENIGSFIEALRTPFGDPNRKFMKRWN